jgi:hypothetical protein
MDNSIQKDSGVSDRTTYQIIVAGKLSEHWADMFNGAMISMTYGAAEKLQTVITIQVRDQAELLGILNSLHGFNLSLLQVILK